MKLLTFTNLYPNSVSPRHGIFVENRLKRILKCASFQSKVVAPVPWFPFESCAFGRWGAFARTPSSEIREGVEIFHPRYLAVPKVGMSISPLLMALAMKRILREIQRRGYEFDLIDAHYFYPDGVAATILGKWFDKPVVVTARGSDINVLPRYRVPEKWIRWAAGECAAVITVSNGLRDRLMKMQVPEHKLHSLRNGVDLDRFRPMDRDLIRREMGITGILILSVGNLVKEKGHALAIQSAAGIPNTRLIIVGSGPDEKRLKTIAGESGIGDRISFIDYLPQSELVRYYNAADLLVLASENEGMPNVLLESMACGTPCVATAVGGVTEILTHPSAGFAVETYSPQSFRHAIEALMKDSPRREDTRAHAAKYDWSTIIEKQKALYRNIGQRV